GRAVALSGAWAMVGAPLKDIGGRANAGAVYVYRRQVGAWSLETTLSSNAGLPIDGERFGSALAMYSHVAVVGVPNGENLNWPADHGYARVFRFNTATQQWQTEASLVSNNPGAGDHYGAAVATDFNFIAVGAPEDDRSAA